MTTYTRRLVREMPPSEQPLTRLQQAGGESLSVAELLAVVLGTADALDLAQELVGQRGVRGLLHMTLPELQAVRGVGPSRAAQVQASLELGRRLLAFREEEAPIRSPADAAARLAPFMTPQEQEVFIVLNLDTNNHVLSQRELYKGSLNSAVVRVAEVFREAIRCQAAAIIVAHTHPSGDPTPSPEDIRVTRDIRQAGTLLDVECLDHLVLGHGRFTSMKEQGLGF